MPMTDWRAAARRFAYLNHSFLDLGRARSRSTTWNSSSRSIFTRREGHSTGSWRQHHQQQQQHHQLIFILHSTSKFHIINSPVRSAYISCLVSSSSTSSAHHIPMLHAQRCPILQTPSHPIPRDIIRSDCEPRVQTGQVCEVPASAMAMAWERRSRRWGAKTHSTAGTAGLASGGAGGTALGAGVVVGGHCDFCGGARCFGRRILFQGCSWCQGL